MAQTLIITADTKDEEIKKVKAFQYMNNHLSLKQIERLEQMAESPKARKMLDTNWAFLKMYI